MKTILLFLLSITAYSQTYNISLVGNYAVASKADGNVTVTDSTYTATFGEKIFSFKVVNKRPEVIYITDGYMVDWVQVIDVKGKKKGIEYSKMLVLNFDARRKINEIVIYYCK